MTVVFSPNGFHNQLVSIIQTCDSANMWPGHDNTQNFWRVKLAFFSQKEKFFMYLKVPFSKPQTGEAARWARSSWLYALRLFIKFLFSAQGGRAGNEVQCCGHNAKLGALPQGEEKGNRKWVCTALHQFYADNNSQITTCALGYA